MKTRNFTGYLKKIFIILTVFFTGLVWTGIEVDAYTSAKYPDRTLNIGETCEFNVTGSIYTGNKFSWTSSNPDVVNITNTVDSNGWRSKAYLEAVAPGDSTISALVDGKVKRTFLIRVTQPALNITQQKMYVGETLRLSQTGIRNVNWKVTGTKSAVSVNRLSSYSVEVKALKAGNATIWAYNDSLNSYVKCEVTVKKVPKSTNTLTATISGKKVKFYQRYAGSTFSGERNLYYISYYSNGYIQYVMEIKFIQSEMKEGSYNSSTRPHDYFVLTKYNEKTHKPQFLYHAQGKSIYGNTYPKGSYNYKINYCASGSGNITFSLNMKGYDSKTNGKTLKVTNGKLDYTLEKIHKTVQKNQSRQDIKIQYFNDYGDPDNSGGNNNSSSSNKLKKCNFCHGSGTCHVCHGAGGEYSTFLGNLKWHKCSICRGSGTCSHCHGSGYKK